MIIEFTYRNHRGQIEQRRVDVDSIEYIRDPGFHYQPGWFLSGKDLDRDARRSFALTHIILPEHTPYYKLLKFREVM